MSAPGPPSPLSTFRGLPHDVGMTRRTATAALAAAVLVAAGTALHPGCAGRSDEGSPLLPGGALAAAPAAPGTRTTGPAAAGGPARTRIAPISFGDRLEAVRTVKLFCDLLGSRRRRQARELLGAPGVLRARELREIRGRAFVSARVKAHALAGTLTVAASVRTSPSRASAARAGVDTLFFTLGRVGTTTGGWLITAVTTSP